MTEEVKTPKPARAKRKTRPTRAKPAAAGAPEGAAKAGKPGPSKSAPRKKKPDGPTKRSRAVAAGGKKKKKKKRRKAPPPPTPGMPRDVLAKQYMPYVRSIAGNVWKTLSKDIEFDDLVSYGMLGLFEAADRFDAKYGANFMTFSYYRIRGAIYDGLRGMGWVSRTEYQKARFEQRANAYLNNVHDRDMAGRDQKRSTDDEVNELADVVGSLVTIYVTALDAMEGFQIKDEKTPAIDESVELLQSRQLVKEAVEKLPEQERKLLQLYYYKENSLEEVGKQLGLSKSWTSRLHARAIDKLSRLLKDLVDEHSDVTGATPVRGRGRKRAQPSKTAAR